MVQKVALCLFALAACALADVSELTSNGQQRFTSNLNLDGARSYSGLSSVTPGPVIAGISQDGSQGIAAGAYQDQSILPSSYKADYSAISSRAFGSPVAGYPVLGKSSVQYPGASGSAFPYYPQYPYIGQGYPSYINQAAGAYPYVSGAVPYSAAGALPYTAGAVPYSAGAVPYSAGAVPYSAGALPYSAAALPYSAAYQQPLVTPYSASSGAYYNQGAYPYNYYNSGYAGLPQAAASSQEVQSVTKQ